MIKTRVRRRGKEANRIATQLNSLNNASVSVGHYQEQGKHHSGFSYPELMAIHHNGGNPSGNAPLPPRPVLDILKFRNQKLSDPLFKKAVKAWGMRTPSPSSNAILLDEIGKILRAKEKAIFGSSALAPNAVPPKSSNTPLVDTGQLRSKVAYRTSISKQVKEG